MAKTIDLRIATALDPKGLSAATKGIQALQTAAKLAAADVHALAAALKQIDGLSRSLPKMPTGGGGSRAPSALPDLAKQERDTLALARAQATLQQASGQGARAEQTLSAALAKVNQDSLAAIRTQTQLVNVQKRLSDTPGPVTLPRTIAGISGEAAKAATAMIGLGSAVAVIGKGIELAQLGAQANQTRQAFDGLAVSAGTTGTALLSALKSASKGEISDLNLELAANKANLLGVADSAAELSTLMEIARDRAQKMGISTTQAFNDLVTGLGRGSALILDNLGITVSVTQANEAYAQSLGKTVAQLTEAEQKQALINMVLSQGQASIAASGGALDTTAGSFARVSAAADNAKAALGGAIAELLRIPAGPVAQGLQWIADGLNQVAGANAQLRDTAGVVIEGANSFAEYGERIAFVNEQLAPFGAHIRALTSAQYDFAKSLIETGTGAADAAAKAEEYATIINTAASADKTWGEGQGELLSQMMALAQGTEYERAAVETLSTWYTTGAISGDTFRSSIATLATQHEAAAQAAARDRIESEHLNATHMTGAQIAAAFADQLVQLTGMTAESANASMLDAQAKQTQQLQMQLLQAQTDQTVASFLRLNPGIDEAGIASLIAAGKIPPLIGQLAALEIQANRARASIAWLNGGQAQQDFRAGERGLGSAAPGSAAQSFQASQRAREAALALAEAQRQQILTTGTASQKLTQLKTDLDKATVSYGANSAEAVKAQTALLQFQQSQIKGGGGGRAAGGGAGAKLDKIRTDEYQKTEDAELQHRKRLLDIEQKYAEKSAEVLKEGEVRKRKSRADFYDALTKAEIDSGVAEQLAADYEKGFAEARKLEQEGKVALARDTERANNERLQAELDYQQALADARKEGNDAEVTRLQAIHALRQQEQDEALKQATEGGDQLQADKQKELDTESLRYEEQLGKIAETSDRKAAAIAKGYDAQATAAERWASAVENATGRVNRAMESVPNAPGGGGSTTAGGDTPGASPAPAGGGNAPGQGLGRTQQSRGGAPNGQPGNTPGTGSGGGAASIGNAGQALIEANAVIMQIVVAGTVSKQVLSQLERYQDTVATATAILSRIADLRTQLQAPAPPIPAAMIQALANEAQAVAAIVAGTITTAALRSKDAILKWSEISEKTISLLKGVADLRETLADPAPPLTGPLVLKLALEVQGVTTLVLSTLLPSTEKQNKALRLYADAASAAIDPLSDVADLRESLADPQPPLTGAQVLKLALEAQGVLYIVEGAMLPTSEAVAEGMQRYADAATAAIGVLAAVADLRKSAADMGPPLTAAIVMKLAAEALGVLYLVQQQMLPVSEQTGEALERYASAAGAAIDLLSGVAALRGDLAEPHGPIQVEDIVALAQEAQDVLNVVSLSLIPVTEDQADAIERYTGAAGNALDLLGGVADLRSGMKDLSAPLRVEDLQRLADEGQRAYEVLATRILPVTEDQAKAAELWASTVGAAVEALKAPLELSGLFANYESPTDEQLNLVAQDSLRIVRSIEAAARTLSTEGMAAAKAFGEANGAVVASFKEQLLFVQALNSGDFTGIQQGYLDTFKQDSLAIIDVARMLGEQAAIVPAGNLTALGNVAGAIGGVADMWLKLASVPFGNLGEIAASTGSAGVPNTTTINIYQQPGQDPRQLANYVINQLNQRTGARR